MENLQPATAAKTAPPRRWPLFSVGVLLFFLGPAIYAVQLGLMKNLGLPWYLPTLASIGVLLMAASLWQRRGVLRSVGLVVFVLVCGLEWFGVLVGPKTPVYTGPAQIGRKLPTFATTLADGRAFTDKDLENGSPTALVFFRGRW